MQRHPLAILLVCLLLAACGADKTAASHSRPGEQDLPQPDAVSGSVTGMPNPGTPSAQPAPLPEPPAEDDGLGFESSDGSTIDPNLPVAPAAAGSDFEVAIPPPETMPTMPAPTPDPVESRVAPPTDS